jgi:aconitate hydratase
MDARSIAATAANQGYLTSAADLDVEYKNHKFTFEKTIYKNRVFDSKGMADKSVEIKFGPNIKDFPTMPPLPSHLILKVVSEIHDPVTTTDELIPSGETSSYRSNPIGLAEYTLSRRDPDYVGRAKEVQKAQKAIQEGRSPIEALEELRPIFTTIEAVLFPNECNLDSEGCGCSSETHTESSLVKLSKEPGKLGVGSTIFAVKPGDGSAREQAASCQKVLGGWANIANEYATKRYRSNLINWGMLPFITSENHKELSFKNGDYLLIPNIRKALEEKKDIIKAYVVKEKLIETELTLGDLTDSEREIILQGCLINYYKENM